MVGGSGTAPTYGGSGTARYDGGAAGAGASGAGRGQGGGGSWAKAKPQVLNGRRTFTLILPVKAAADIFSCCDEWCQGGAAQPMASNAVLLTADCRCLLTEHADNIRTEGLCHRHPLTDE